MTFPSPPSDSPPWKVPRKRVEAAGDGEFRAFVVTNNSDGSLGFWDAKVVRNAQSTESSAGS
jgi:hypothetical protein